MLKNWCAAGRLMLKDMDLEDMAALKVCLLAMGTLLGLSVPFRWKKPAALLGSFLFGRLFLSVSGHKNRLLSQAVCFAEVPLRPACSA